MSGLVYDQDVGLACFLLPDPESIPWFYTLDMLYLELQEIPDAKAIVDTHSEQEVIPGAVGQ